MFGKPNQPDDNFIFFRPGSSDKPDHFANLDKFGISDSFKKSDISDEPNISKIAFMPNIVNVIDSSSVNDRQYDCDDMELPPMLYTIPAYLPGLAETRPFLVLGLVMPFLDMGLDYLGIGLFVKLEYASLF